ncbi:MAG: peptide deformylase [Candidatus Paceibacteria bacterium]|jgi:peptide deformylase
MKEIVQHPHTVLRKEAELVSNFNTQELRETLNQMSESLESQEDGVALAAPQINISKRIFVVAERIEDITDGEMRDEFRTVFINPEIIKKSNDSKLMEEGCLSVRYKYGKIRRASRVKVKAYDFEGNQFETEGIGLIAQIFQHEIEHLDGILFIDSAIDVEELPPRDNE